MGSLMGRRWVAGSGQLLVAVAGFVIFCIGFIRLCVETYHDFTEGTISAAPTYRLMLLGMGNFALAWIWALVTSLSLRHEAAANERAADDENQTPLMDRSEP